jgi:hypothetical protein
MDGKMSQYTTFLFARPSFTEGLARVLDVGGTLNVYNTSPTPERADYRAIKADWLATGNDIWNAFNDFFRENQEVIKRGNGRKTASKESPSTSFGEGRQ